MTTKDRLLMFLKFKGIGQTRFEESADLSRGLVNNIKGSISTKTASKIALAYPELNMEWLLNGEGEMLKTPTKKQIPLYDDDVTIGGMNGSVANVDGQARPTDFEVPTKKRRHPKLKAFGASSLKNKYVGVLI